MNIFNIACNSLFASKMDHLAALMSTAVFFNDVEMIDEETRIANEEIRIITDRAARVDERKRIRAQLQDPRIQKRIEMQRKYGVVTPLRVSSLLDQVMIIFLTLG